jgi:pre-rRNA-processing protein TSR4
MNKEIEDDDVTEDGLECLLGFVDPPQNPRDLLRHRFPSKVGGRPAWLNPLELPTTHQLTCSVTGQPLRFLLQVYAPPPEEVENVEAFHRTMFLFVSSEGGKLTQPGTVRALRCQLPRYNPFYASEAPSSSDHFPPSLLDAAQCAPGRDPWQVLETEEKLRAQSSRRRGKKSGVNREQTTEGTGKQQEEVAGGSSAGPSTEEPSSSNSNKGSEEGDGRGMHLYPELELLVEPEAEMEQEAAAADPLVKRLVKQYEEQVAQEGELTEEELPEELIDQVEGSLSAQQRHYAMFQTRVSYAPEQCLRYCFREGAVPLCPSPEGIPKASSIPPCSRCGGPRIFEFQVMPQLLNYLDIDPEDPCGLDWGTIAVYSCKASCAISMKGEGEATGSAYADEFVWVQGA